jgi:hypothetical protein
MKKKTEVKKITVSSASATMDSRNSSKEIANIKSELSTLKESLDSFKSKNSFSAFWADYRAVRAK